MKQMSKSFDETDNMEITKQIKVGRFALVNGIWYLIDRIYDNEIWLSDENGKEKAVKTSQIESIAGSHYSLIDLN